MKKYIYSVAFYALTWLGLASFVSSKKIPDNNVPESFNEFKVKGIDGKEIRFSDFKGKKILIVNVASYCGYTYQYEALEKLHQKYKDKLVIIGFPCNQFGFQEPDKPEEIKAFCTKKYNVTFSVTEKIDVKGNAQHPVYQWLTKKVFNKIEDSEVSWNFNKYLIDENGNYIKHFKSKTEPMSEEIISLIEKK